MAAKLKKKYFVSKVEQLHYSDPGKWWSKTKCILELDNSNPLANLDYAAVTAAIRPQSAENVHPKSKNEFVGGKHRTTPSLILPNKPHILG